MMQFLLRGLFFALLASADAQTGDVQYGGVTKLAAQQTRDALERGKKSPIDSTLRALGQTTRKGAELSAFIPSSLHPATSDSLVMRVQDGRVLIDAVAKHDVTSSLEKEMREVGLENVTAFGKYVSGWLPVGSVIAPLCRPRGCHDNGRAVIAIGGVQYGQSRAAAGEVARGSGE